MAIWQFQMHGSLSTSGKSVLSREQSQPLITDIKNLFGEQYDKKYFSPDYICFGDVEGDDCSVSFENDNLDYLFIRFDMRSLTGARIQEFCKFVKKWNISLTDVRENPIRPDYEGIVESLKKSNGYRYLQDPYKFFDWLKENPIKND